MCACVLISARYSKAKRRARIFFIYFALVKNFFKPKIALMYIKNAPYIYHWKNRNIIYIADSFLHLCPINDKIVYSIPKGAASFFNAKSKRI